MIKKITIITILALSSFNYCQALTTTSSLLYRVAEIYRNAHDAQLAQKISQAAMYFEHYYNQSDFSQEVGETVWNMECDENTLQQTTHKSLKALRTEPTIQTYLAAMHEYKNELETELDSLKEEACSPYGYDNESRFTFITNLSREIKICRFILSLFEPSQQSLLRYTLLRGFINHIQGISTTILLTGAVALSLKIVPTIAAINRCSNVLAQFLD